MITPKSLRSQAIYKHWENVKKDHDHPQQHNENNGHKHANKSQDENSTGYPNGDYLKKANRASSGKQTKPNSTPRPLSLTMVSHSNRHELDDTLFTYPEERSYEYDSDGDCIMTDWNCNFPESRPESPY